MSPMDGGSILLTALQALTAGVVTVAVLVAAWEHRRARLVQRAITRTAILRTDKAADRHGLIDDLAHAVRHHESATQALWVALAALVVAWWLW